MGCFSFISPVNGDPINSDSFSGEQCYLVLLKDGIPIEMMYGNYDSYGRVFDVYGDSFEWDMDWDEVCDLMFHDNHSNGIVAIHASDYISLGEVPRKRSEGDPNQGWGDYKHNSAPVDKPYHVVMNSQ